MIKRLKQVSTWEGFITAAVSVALLVDAVTTGGSVTAILGALGSIASATSILRDDDKDAEDVQRIARDLRYASEVVRNVRVRDGVD